MDNGKKTIKIKFIGFWDDFVPEKFICYQILQKHYNIEICDDADYVFCSLFGTPFEYCNYPQVRIMFSYENYIPDFNFIDYSICPYPITFLDRSFHLPVCVDEVGMFKTIKTLNRNMTKEDLKNKIYFADFICSHESEGGIRGDFFKKLNEYKRVESAGTYLNNMPNGMTVKLKDGTKTELQKKCKFTISFESTYNEGFVTEKLTNAFCAGSVPIYYGSLYSNKIFNKDAYINCAEYDSFDSVIEKIKEIDNDDEKYLSMVNAPILNDMDYYEKKYAELEKFLLNIFEQPYEKSFRRSKVYMTKWHNDLLGNLANDYNERLKGPKLNRVLKKVFGEKFYSKLQKIKSKKNTDKTLKNEKQTNKKDKNV